MAIPGGMTVWVLRGGGRVGHHVPRHMGVQVATRRWLSALQEVTLDDKYNTGLEGRVRASIWRLCFFASY